MDDPVEEPEAGAEEIRHPGDGGEGGAVAMDVEGRQLRNRHEREHETGEVDEAIHTVFQSVPGGEGLAQDMLALGRMLVVAGVWHTGDSIPPKPPDTLARDIARCGAS